MHLKIGTYTPIERNTSNHLSSSESLCIAYSQALNILQMEVLRKLSMEDAITYGDYTYLNYRINLSRVISTVSTWVAI